MRNCRKPLPRIRPDPVKARSFTVRGREVSADYRQVRLGYCLEGQELVETFQFPPGPEPDRTRRQALDRALELLHWVAGVSYWKAVCPPEIRFDSSSPDPWQARWLARYWREGLAEFAWRNRLDDSIWPTFQTRESGGESQPPQLDLPARALVPLGGGKDSLVALERVRGAGVGLVTCAVSSSPLIASVAESTGVDHLPVRRQLDPVLAELNRKGAWNGHVPITAINAAALTVLALLEGCRWVVFANERSADEPTLVGPDGQAVNHQFSKSLAFEEMFGQWISGYVTGDLEVFSILRQERELAICREFAGLERYHQVFSSCNRNFHLDGRTVSRRWCGDCPKCHFVFIGLAPFMDPDELVAIFGSNLLADPDHLAGFRALLALDGEKPFECVGEAAESRAALGALVAHEAWRDLPVVAGLAGDLADVEVPELKSMLQRAGPHRIPEAFAR